VEKWRSVIKSLSLDKITAKSIRNFLFSPTESDKAVATIRVPATVHEELHTEAAKRGLSIVELLKMMLDFFLKGGNSHLLQYDVDTINYADKERIWGEDLAELVNSGPERRYQKR
jgi:hypothetical protein